MTAFFGAIRWRWIALGVAAYLIFLLITLPASIVVKKLQTQGIVAGGVAGSIWNGRAASLQVRGVSIGSIKWRVHPSAFFLGRLNVDVNIKREDGFADAAVSIRRGGKIALRDLRATLPIPTLMSYANINPLGGNLTGGMLGGWKGALQLQLNELVIEQGWPTYINGAIDAVELIGPARQPTAIGSYRIDFAPTDAATGELQGAIASQPDSPLDVIGVVRLMPGKQYVIDAQVGTRGNAPASITKQLEYLGAPDAEGRRPLSIAGSL